MDPSILGTRLEPVVARFLAEVRAAGFTRLEPEVYLADEWGVPFPSAGIAVPEYLTSAEATARHAAEHGHVEGTSPADVLRYLRHEFGHVVNYAYRLYEREDWTRLFGSFAQPYRDEYRPEPFSRRFVRHLPGWYAQKHPDEDWAETFAVWMTPGLDWRAEYAGWPALAKLDYCDRVVAEVRGRDPDLPAADGGDGDESFDAAAAAEEVPGIDGALRAVFEDDGGEPAARLIAAVEPALIADVFRWTGHFPERTRTLLRHLAGRAEELGQVYRPDREREAVVALTALVTALAMNHVLRGEYFPGPAE